MKKFLKILPALLLVFATSVFAGVSNFDSVQTRPTVYDSCAFSVQDGSGNILWCIDGSGGTTIAKSGVVQNFVSLPLLGFSSGNAAISGSTVSSSTMTMLPTGTSIVNGYSYANGFQTIGIGNINAATPVSIMFKVPGNYSSSGAFKVLATETESTTPNKIGFDVWVLRNGVNTLPTAVSNAKFQTPVALTQKTTTPSVVTLTPVGDTAWAALAAGDWVMFRLWRTSWPNPTTAPIGALHIYGADFFYTGSY